MAKHYKFRAEAYIDVCWLCAQLGLQLEAIDLEGSIRGGPSRGEPVVTITLDDGWELDAVRDIMRNIEDSHVMLQTVQLLENYTGERDYTLE